MNRTIELVNHWGAFEESHPEGSIEEFCRYYLARQEQKKEEGPLLGGAVPDLNAGILLKIMGRIHKLNMAYANMALKGTDLNQVEEFGMLLTISLEKNPKKTEVIYANLFELSSGTDMLNRLKSRGLITEYDDADDKRSKRIELTPKGEKVVDECMAIIRKNASMMLYDMKEDDMELCIQLLKNTEIKFSALWQKHRGKGYDDVYAEIMNMQPEE